MELGQDAAGAEPSVSTATGRSEGPSQVSNGDVSANTSPVPAAKTAGSSDFASDISMASNSDSDDSDTSDSAEPATEPQPQPAVSRNEHIQDGMDTASKKRKSPGGDSPDPGIGELSSSEPHKKVRLDVGSGKSSVSMDRVPDKSLLAPEVWHHIFTFCPPKTLGNLLRVNKLFHQYLNPSSPAQIDFPTSAPRGVLSVLKPNHIWQSSRRFFWPHMPAPLRSMSELSMWRLLCSTKCQECNKPDAHDAELPEDNLHNGPGSGGVAVIWPFGIRVCGTCLLERAIKEIDVLLSSTVPSTLIPALPFVHITKELHVVSLSTIEQGLLPADIQVTKLFLASDLQEIKQEFFSVKTLGSGTLEEWIKGLEPRGQARLTESRKWEKWANTPSLHQVRQAVDPYMSNRGAAGTPPMAAMSASETVYPQPPAHVSQERTLQEVSGLKAARKAEIERRASLLDPPLQPDVLRHMATFQASTQLITPLDDRAWDILKPRLLAERAEAEEIENKITAQIRMIQARDSKSHLEATLATTKEAKDAIDRDWEQVQAPLRARIVSYADEIIRTGWDKGKKVKQENCARFAAEALIHIRKRFYAEVAKDAETAKAAGKEPVTDPPEGPFTQKLTLENMRWIFDTKIKPLTAPLRKEVFYCNGCAAKPFGFEGVVQHYAAKHTDALSSGNIVVHWRAEWPEVPPFNPEGRTKVMPPVPGAMPYPPAAGPMPPYSFNGYAPPHNPAIPPPGQFAPVPQYGAPPYTEYAYQYPGYPPTSSYAPPVPGAPPQPYAAQAGWAAYQGGPTPNGPYPQNPGPPHPVGYQQPMAPAPATVPTPAPPTVPGPYNYGPGGYPGNALPPYSVQLDDIVRNSREIWNATANIRDLPGSARIFVTIHHVVQRFRTRFAVTPPLAIFQDGLSNHKDMRPVRNINSLACKACQLGLGNAAYVQEDRKSFSLPQLVNHFQSKHVEPMQKTGPNSPPLDWTVDMILLPVPAVLAKLRGAVGSDGLRYRLFSEAFPEVFGQVAAAPVPPYIGQPQQPHATYQPEPHYPVAALPPAADNHERFYVQQHGGRQAQGQHDAVAQNPFQPNRDYAQGRPANSYVASLQGPTYHPEHAPPNSGAAPVADHDASRREDSGNQVSRLRQAHITKWPRKNKNRNVQNAQSGLNKHSGPDVKIKEEEPNMPEEEKAREEQIRAMWATDRVATARAFRNSAKADTENPSHQAKTEPNQDQPQAAARESRGDMHQESRRPAAQHIGRPLQEEPSLLDALEMHLDQSRRPDSRGQQPKDHHGAAYADGSHTVTPEANRGRREAYEAREPSIKTHSSPGPHGADLVAPPREAYEAREPSIKAPSSFGADFGRRPRERYEARETSISRSISPGAGYDLFRVRDYSPHRAANRRQPSDDFPQPRRRDPSDHVYGPPEKVAGQHHDPPPGRRADTHQPYDRGYRPEEPVYGRPPPPERPSQDYYRRPSYAEDVHPPPPRERPTGQLYEIVEVIDAQGSYFIRRPIGRAPPPDAAYYDYPYDDDRLAREQRQPPIGGGPEPYPPRPSGDDGYPRPAPPPPRQALAPQQHRDEYSRPLSSSAHRPWGGDYPLPPPPPGQYHQRPASRLDRPARNPYDEEEYDPRYPAAPPPGNLQRRQVRYE